jgi:hypothetical protein
MLYENETGYIDALEHAWISSIALSGFLLEGGFMTADSMDLDMPTRMMEQMGSMDRSSRVFDRPQIFDRNAVLRRQYPQLTRTHLTS